MPKPLWSWLKSVFAPRRLPLRRLRLEDLEDRTVLSSVGLPLVPTGTGPQAVVVGDFTGHGKRDLAVANKTDGTVSILLGNGDGTFKPAVNYLVGASPVALAVADFNGDHEQDLVVANSADGTVSILLGKGDGTFQPAVAYDVNANPSAVAVGHFNSDGNLDLAVTNLGDPNDGTGSGVTILLGNGNGTFQAAAAIPSYGLVTTDFGPPVGQITSRVAVNPDSIAVADLRGDGKDDLIVGNYGDNSGDQSNVSVLLGNGDGTFQTPVNYQASFSDTGIQSIAVGDLFGDGKLDLVVANRTDSSVNVLVGGGDGTFGDPQTLFDRNGPILADGSAPDAVALADFNGDGMVDILVANHDTNTVTVLLGNAASDFAFTPGPTLAAGTAPTSLAVGDFAGEGETGIAVADFQDNAVSILLNQRFQVSAPTTVTAGTPFDVTITAVDALGHPFAGYPGTIHFTSSDAAASLPNDYSFAPALDGGSHTFSVTLRTAGPHTLDFLDPFLTSTTVTVLPAAPASLKVTGFQPSLITGTTQTFGVTAQDAFGNITTKYVGKVAFRSSDGLGVVPDAYTFVPGDNGTHVFQVTLRTLGSQTVTVTDAVDNIVTHVTPEVQPRPDHYSGFLAQPNQFDLYPVFLDAGERVNVQLNALTAGSALQSLLRIFDAGGRQVALNDQEGGDPELTFQAAIAGTYRVGVSAAGDDAYDPNTPGSGSGGATTGLYTLDVRRTTGTPVQSDLAAASFRLGAETAAWGENVPVTFTIENRGGLLSGDFAVEVVLATDPSFGPSSNLQVLKRLPASGELPGLATGQLFAPGPILVPLPSSAPSGFGVSGPVYLGLRIVPSDPALESSLIDKVGVLRGSDWETLTVVTPLLPGATDLSAADPNLNTRTSGTLSGPGQSIVYSLTVTQSMGSGGLTATVAAISGNLAARLTLLAASTGQILVQSDSGSIAPHLQPGSYYLIVSAASGSGDYRLVTRFVAGNSPFAALPFNLVELGVVAVADVNGDGQPDLITNASVALGNGDGTFQATIPFSASPPQAVADLNGDGRPDLISSDGVALGNGDGTFRAPIPLSVNGPVTVADVNGDGIPDLLIPNTGASIFDYVNSVSVLLGKGDGTFQTPRTVIVPFGRQSLAVADFNGDGLPDLVVTSSVPVLGPFGQILDNPTSISVLPGNGDGTFQAPQLVFANHGLTSVIVTDVNGDSRPDLVFDDTQNNSVDLLLNKGDGTFASPRIYPIGVKSPFPVTVARADVNNDGHLDILIDNTVSVVVLLGTGDGTYQPAQTAAATPGFTAMVDMNGDGRLDLVTSSGVELGNGDGTFQTLQTISDGLSPGSAVPADFNGDGRVDVVFANQGGNTDSVLLGNGDGTFQARQSFTVGKTTDVTVVADVNGDGRPDIVATNYDAGTVSILLGLGDGSFQAQRTFTAGLQPFFTVVADITGDGKPDLIVADAGTPTGLLGSGPRIGAGLLVLQGNGDGTFQPARPIATAFTPSSLAIGDLNGDGIPDLIVGDDADQSIQILQGNGDGTFRAPRAIPAGGNADAVVVADLRSDGKADLIVIGSDFGPGAVAGVRLLANDNGSFQPAQLLVSGFAGVTVADFNGDGHPDLLLSYALSDSVSPADTVFLGDGSGSFPTKMSIFDPVLSVSAQVVADVNGDGRLDLVRFKYGQAPDVLLGNGDGTFTPASPRGGIGVRNTPYQVDLNGDGIPDSVILDNAGNLLFRKGLGAGQYAPPRILNPGRIARDLTVLRTATGWAVATADALPDPALSSPGNFVYTVSVYELTVGGTVTRRTAFSSSMVPTRLAAADLTGNGLDDLVVTDTQDNRILVASQQADGRFSSPLILNTGDSPSDLALVDVNGDGLKDIVVTNQASGDITVFFNDPGHSFSASGRFRAGTGLYDLTTTPSPSVSSLAQPISLAAGDFTGVLGSGGTGQNDLVVVNRSAHDLTVLANDGAGGFSDPQAALISSTSDGVQINEQPGPIVAGDFNRDGKLDVAVLMEDRAEVWIFSNDGHGHFTHTFSVAAGTLPTGLNVVRNAASGFDDLLVGNSFGDILRLVGKGDGTFEPPPPLTGDGASLDVQLLQGDIPDVLVADQKTNSITVQTPTANGANFAPVQTLASDPSSHLAPGAVQWAKLEGPAGFFDAVVMASGSNSVLVYHTISVDPATGKPSFIPPASYSVGTDPVAVTIQGLNGDGIPDMLVANKGSNDISVLFGSIVNGQWVGTPGPRLNSHGNGPVATTLRDMNGDGIPDLVVANSDGKMTVLPGVGQGFFNDVNPLPPMIVAVGLTAPSFIGTSGIGFAVTGDGGIVRIDLNTFTANLVFQPGAGAVVNTLEALADGDVIAAFDNGRVAELLADASGKLDVAHDFATLSGDLTDPSALQKIDTGSGIEVLVTNAGSDQIFVFTPVSSTLPMTEVIPSRDTSLTVVVTFIAGGATDTSLTQTEVSPSNSDTEGIVTANGIESKTVQRTNPLNGATDALNDEDADRVARGTTDERTDLGIDVDGKLKSIDLNPQKLDNDPDNPTSRLEAPLFPQAIPLDATRQEALDALFSSWRFEAPALPVFSALAPTETQWPQAIGKQPSIDRIDWDVLPHDVPIDSELSPAILAQRLPAQESLAPGVASAVDGNECDPEGREMLRGSLLDVERSLWTSLALVSFFTWPQRTRGGGLREDATLIARILRQEMSCVPSVRPFKAPDAALRRKLVENWHEDIRGHIDLEQAVASTDGYSFAEIEELKNLLVMHFMDSATWNWGWALKQFDVNRSELSARPQRSVGFGGRGGERAARGGGYTVLRHDQ